MVGSAAASIARKAREIAAIDWQLRESGPREAEHTVLLLPGAMCAAGSWAEVMAQPALARMRLVAVTLPGHAGAPAPADVGMESNAGLTADLAAEIGADVVVGFSMGASVALEMVASGRFAGPVILLGISLSPKDESVVFRALVRLGDALGRLPATVLMKGAAALVKATPVPAERQAELREDFSRNVPGDVRRSAREYLRWLHRHPAPAERLCRAGVPTWIVHAEKGDGGLTDHERGVLEACPHAHVITVPGDVFFLPNGVPERIAELIGEAVSRAR